MNKQNSQQQVTNKDELSPLTENLIQAKKDNNLQEMLKIASERKEMLFKKLSDNPQDFVSYATLGKQRIDFPQQVRPFIEEEIELQGKLIVVISDDFTNQISKTDYFLETDGNRFSLYFSGDPPQLLSGSEILIKGIRLDNSIVLSSD